MKSLTYALDTTWRTLLTDLGIAPANVLRRAGLPDDLLNQPSVRLEPMEYYRLWESAEQELGDSLFPIRVCKAIRTESFSPPLFAALCSPNLLTAAQRVAKYKRLIGPMQMEARDDQETLTIVFTWTDGDPVPVSLVTMELLFWATLARIGTREAVSPIKVTTTVLPSQRGPYEDYLGAPFLKGPRHTIRFAKSDVLRPFLTSNAPLWAAFEPDLRQRLADLDASVNMAGRVRAALHEAIPSGLMTMEAIADKLAMSKRTLQRRIEAEDTSFQQILKETREALARHYLEKTDLPASEISFLLGFDEPNSFYRAFRYWTGKTPDSLRQHA
jgi:AraC-like DNA-binding protein